MYRVGVVGFGMAGATAAFLLARDGHRVTLLERAPEVGPVGAGVLLQCSGQAVLRHLGILDRVLAHAAQLEALDARHSTGGRMICNRFPDYTPESYAYGVHRGVLFSALFDLVKTQPVDVRTGCEVIARSDSTDGVTLTDKCGRKHGPFDVIIAADGSRSRTMRDICGFKASVTEYDHGTFWVNVPGDGVKGKLIQVVQRTRRLFGLLPLGDGLVSMYWGLAARDLAATKARGLDALKREIVAFAPESAPVLDFIHDFEQFLFTRYRHVHCRRHHDERVILIGDAAHAMSPHLGQGINLAMVDAWRLAAALREEATPQAAFRAFRRQQKAFIRYYATVTYMLSPFFQSDWGILGWGRDWALPLLPYIPWVKRQMLMTVCGLKGGFLKGEIEV